MKELSYDELLQKHREEQNKKKEEKDNTELDTSRDVLLRFEKEIGGFFIADSKDCNETEKMGGFLTLKKCVAN